MDAAPGQFQVGNLAADLVGFDHHYYFTGDLGHHAAQAQQFVERGGAALQIDAVGADEQLIKVVGTQHLLGNLALERVRMRVPVPPVISSTGSCSSSLNARATCRELVITTRPGW